MLTLYWYPKVPTEQILTPPDLTDVPCESDEKLAPGDLFYHRTAGEYKLWLWTVVEDSDPFWKPVWYGYLREDGRRLIVTPVTKQPGWVSKEHYSKSDHGTSGTCN